MTKNSGHTTKWMGPGKLVVNCPFCTISPAMPPANAITVRPGGKHAACKAGHIFPVYSRSRPPIEQIVIQEIV